MTVSFRRQQGAVEGDGRVLRQRQASDVSSSCPSGLHKGAQVSRSSATSSHQSERSARRPS